MYRNNDIVGNVLLLSVQKLGIQEAVMMLHLLYKGHSLACTA